MGEEERVIQGKKKNVRGSKDLQVSVYEWTLMVYVSQEGEKEKKTKLELFHFRGAAGVGLDSRL